MEGLDEFQRLIAAVVTRYFRQLQRSAFPGDVTRFAAQLGELIRERGLPAPLRADEPGAPGSMSEPECAPLVARVAQGLNDPLFAELARQLVKACFYPEFKVCRDSFREVTTDGACRRQELARVRSRVSGTHCVDCPHWVVLDAEAHREYLAREWHGAPQIFAEHRAIFLPEDFRALRRWLHAARRDR
jgi:hypothetical protein